MTALDKRPIAVKSATSFFGFMIGDLLAQTITGHGAYDVFRTLRLVSRSTVHHCLYRWKFARPCIHAVMPVGKSACAIIMNAKHQPTM